MKRRGIVAARHRASAEAAREILGEGGNAFDAVVGGVLAACVAEPLLASLGGGGFLLAGPAGGLPLLYDFFAQTPSRSPVGDADFYPIQGDFGGVTQEFHIGRGSIAVPGVVRGLFAIQRDLGTMPIGRLVEPAVQLAREGARHNPCQAYIEQILRPILRSTESMRRLFPEGRDVFRNPELGDFLEILAREGDDFFYRGEPARRLARDCSEGGGLVSADDLRRYRVERRRPLSKRHGRASVLLNPAPSTGGPLIAFTLELLERGAVEASPLLALVLAQQETNRVREEAIERRRELAEHLADDAVLAAALATAFDRPGSSRGTTHLSVADSQGNLASLTISNGEGSGYVLPGTGILVNNFLGEEDLFAEGIGSWRPDERMASMMCPTLVEEDDGRRLALGSGGSNRLRTAILQVLITYLDHDLELAEAVTRPRAHCERGQLDLEPGFPDDEVEAVRRAFPNLRIWDDLNLFFGGVHAVTADGTSTRFQGIGDPRRDGVCIAL